MATKKPVFIPYRFFLDALEEELLNKAFFGARAYYRDDLILFILREKDSYTNDNGIWVATSAEHHPSLRSELPSLRSLEIFGPGETAWQVLPADSDGFEEEAFRLAELVREQDPRIGRVPKGRRKNMTKRPAKTGSAEKSVKKKVAKKAKRRGSPRPR